MPIKISNYTQAGFVSANAVRFVRQDDSPNQRKDITVSRKASVYDSKTDRYSIPEYRIAIRKDTTFGGASGDTERPTGQRLTFDLTMRTPLYADVSEIEEARAELVAFLNDEDFLDSLVRQLFPVDCPCE